MKVLFICGGRERKGIVKELTVVVQAEQPNYVMHGDAPGADRLADLVARKLGIQPIVLPALWSALGKQAGPIRNTHMLHLLAALENSGWQVACHAWPGDGPGTRNMIRQLKKVGLEVEIHQ